MLSAALKALGSQSGAVCVSTVTLTSGQLSTVAAALTGAPGPKPVLFFCSSLTSKGAAIGIGNWTTGLARVLQDSTVTSFGQAYIDCKTM